VKRVLEVGNKESVAEAYFCPSEKET